MPAAPFIQALGPLVDLHPEAVVIDQDKSRQLTQGRWSFCSVLKTAAAVHSRYPYHMVVSASLMLCGSCYEVLQHPVMSAGTAAPSIATWTTTSVRTKRFQERCCSRSGRVAEG